MHSKVAMSPLPRTIFYTVIYIEISLGTCLFTAVLNLDSSPSKNEAESADPDEREEKRRRKREAAKQEVLRRLEKLTIGGEALGDAEIKRRRERRRKRLQALAEALEKSSKEGNGGGAFEVYGQLKSTEEALKRMAKKAKQLEAEAADLQVSGKSSFCVNGFLEEFLFLIEL